MSGTRFYLVMAPEWYKTSHGGFEDKRLAEELVAKMAAAGMERVVVEVASHRDGRLRFTELPK
jgi:hypothetical protein